MVLEVSGAPEALDTALKTIAYQSTVTIASWYGVKPVSLHLGEEFHRNRITLRSSQVSNIDPALMPRWDIPRRKELALSLLPGLKLKELITHRYPFAEAALAFETIDKHPEEVIQVILKYDV